MLQVQGPQVSGSRQILGAEYYTRDSSTGCGRASGLEEGIFCPESPNNVVETSEIHLFRR